MSITAGLDLRDVSTPYDLRRMKHAFARGAQLQVCVNGFGKWLDCDAEGTVDGVNSAWVGWDHVRVHPKDAHLEYGRVSQALIDTARWHDPYADPEDQPPLEIAALMVMIASMLNADEMDAVLNMVEGASDEGIAILMLLFGAEFLADEGL